MMYQRLTEGLNSIGKLIPDNSNIQDFLKKDKDYYLSIYKYTEAHKKIAEEIIDAERVDKETKQIIKYKRPRGIESIEDVITNILGFDFDDDANLEKAKQDTITTVERLMDNNIDIEDINVSFSGGKGFSIVVYHDKNLTPSQHRKIAEAIAGDLETFDSTLYNASRIFRIDGTKHNKTGLYKTQLDPDMLYSSIDEIKEFAKIKHTTKIFKRTTLPESFFNLVPKEKKVEKSTEEAQHIIDFSKKPYYLTDLKYALHKGFIPPSDGNEGMMILCSTYKHVGFDMVDAYHMLKGVNEKRAEIYNIPKRDNNAIWKEVVEVVYDPSWKGGTYSIENSKLLQETAKKFGITEHSKLESFDSIKNSFFEFADKINENVIKTGIKSLDETLLITTGMMVGVLGAPSAGKCLGKGTLIRMFDGSTKKVEDIKVGDLLMGDDSTPRKVLSTCTGKEQLYKVKQLNGNDYIVNESHILCLKNNVEFSDKKRFNKFKDKFINIEVKDYLKQSNLFKKHYKGYKVGVEYNQKETNLNPYVMGMWLGDGTSSKPNITNTDPEVIAYLDNYFSKYNLTRKTYDKITHSYTTSVGQENYRFNFFKESLIKDGVLNNKFIPDSYLLNNRKNRLALLAGLIDSDGYYDSRRNAYEISFKNLRLATETLELIRSLGFKAEMNLKTINYNCVTKNKKYSGATTTNRIYFSGQNLNEIPVLLDRKKASFGTREVSYDSYGIELEKLEVGDYYGFEIDGNRKFLLGDFTVTHNTSLVTSIIEKSAKDGMKPLFHSLDMTKHLMMMRLIQRQSGVNTQDRLRKRIKGDPKYDDNYNMRTDTDIQTAVENLGKIYRNVEFNFTRGATIESIEEDIKANKAKNGDKFKLVVVDYLEKVRGPYSDATANSGYVASRLSDLASTYDVCIILLLQPQKSAGDPSQELLSMRNVKGASVIEQDCRVVLTMWRPGFNPRNNTDDRYASVAIVKNNMGEVRTLDYSWSGLKGELKELTNLERDQLESLRERLAEERERNDTGWDI